MRIRFTAHKGTIKDETRCLSACFQTHVPKQTWADLNVKHEGPSRVKAASLFCSRQRVRDVRMLTGYNPSNKLEHTPTRGILLAVCYIGLTCW